MTVEGDRGNRIIGIGQQQYVLDMLERFSMVDASQWAPLWRSML
jgi:hypothetical protein